jgi:hypothetical protein
MNWIFSRRKFLSSTAICLASASTTKDLWAAAPSGYQSFDDLLDTTEKETSLKQRLSNDRERFEYAVMSLEVERGKPIARTRKSDLRISERAQKLIVFHEVTSKAVYIKKYQGLVWPGGESGPTAGIGYDFGYVDPGVMEFDWEGILAPETIEALKIACRVTRQRSRVVVRHLRNVRISWEQASENFERLLPFYCGATEWAFPNCQMLSADAFGALVSIVYNRGNGYRSRKRDAKQRRLEMSNIRRLMTEQRFSEIPSQVRSMQRLWPDNEGLRTRRELEARLFEAGLPT